MWVRECKKTQHKEEVVMGMGSTESPDDFKEQIKQIEEMGFIDIENIREAVGMIPYGMHILHDIDDVDENGSVESTKAYTVASNPIFAMAEVWETQMQMGLSAGLKALGDLFTKAIENNELEVIVKGFIASLDDEGGKFASMFLQAIWRSQPDVISIGNPFILNHVVAGKIDDAKFSDDIENFLKMVSEEGEEE